MECMYITVIGRKQRDLMEVIREHSEMLPPEEVEQIHRQLTLPSVPHKHHPSDLSAHPYQHSSYQLPPQYDKQSPSKQMIDSSNVRVNNKSPYTIPPLAPYFSRKASNSSGDDSGSSSSSSSSSGNSNSNFHLGRITSYPFPMDSRNGVHNASLSNP